MCAVLSPSTSNFYPRPPRGGRPTTPTRSVRRTYFYPRPPRGGRLAGYHGGHRDGGISIHALREEGDDDSAHLVVDALLFLSTPSARRATVIARRGVVVDVISIHALREEGDHPSAARSLTSSRFLSTPSARRATPEIAAIENLLRKFLSTPSARRATRIPGQERVGPRNFYPRPPRGGRRAAASSLARLMDDFYPRPPRGGRPRRLVPSEAKIQFLSTPSARRATDAVLPLPTLDELFLSTPSARRATDAPPPRAALPTRISIHALREEGDVAVVALLHDVCNFYPRPPRGGRLANIAEQRVDFFISIHALREEGDTLAATLARTYKISIHALREEGDPSASLSV